MLGLVALVVIVVLTGLLFWRLREHPLRKYTANAIMLTRVCRWRDFYAAFHTDGIRNGAAYPKAAAIQHAREFLAKLDGEKAMNHRGHEGHKG